MRNHSIAKAFALELAHIAEYGVSVLARMMYEDGLCTRLNNVHIAQESPVKRVADMGLNTQNLQLSVVRI